MKVGCFIPIKLNSKRVRSKNFRLLRGKKLYQIVIDKCKNLKCFDKVMVDTDSKEIQRYCIENSIDFIDREPFYSSDKASGNDLIDNWIHQHPDIDIIVQPHATSPFLKEETLINLVSIMKSGAYDSALTASKEQTWYWYNNKPVNYSIDKLTRSQDANFLIKETF